MTRWRYIDELDRINGRKGKAMGKKPAGEAFKSAADLATHVFGYMMLLIVGTVVGFLVIPYYYGWALGPSLVALAAVGHVMQAFEK